MLFLEICFFFKKYLINYKCFHLVKTCSIQANLTILTKLYEVSYYFFKKSQSMNKSLTLSVLIALIGSVTAFAQAEISIDQRLYDVFDASFLKKLQTDKSFHLHYYNFSLDNSYEIIEIPKEKNMQLPKVEIKDLDKINILKLQQEQKLTKSYDAPTYYQIKGSDKILMIRSEKDFAKRLNKHLDRI